MQARTISIHAPRTGSDNTREFPKTGAAHFNPRSPHGERLPAPLRICSALRISIHAPRTGSDEQAKAAYDALIQFQSTLPARGATEAVLEGLLFTCQFQSTLPARGATSSITVHLKPSRFQSTLPARGATENLLHTVRDYIISIHAPRTGSDMRHTSAARLHLISIHAPRTGSDGVSLPRELRRIYFNPRSPHGERQAPSVSFLPGTYFKPRSPHGERPGEPPPPARGPPSEIFSLPPGNVLKPPLPELRATRGTAAVRRRLIYFNPRSPHGERLKLSGRTSRQKEFQSTLPARGATKLTFVDRKR